MPDARIGPIENLLRSRWLYHLAAVIFTFMFWGSGLSKALDFPGATQEMAHFGLNPPAAFAAATVFVQLAGALLVISGHRLTWLGAGALAVFTALTIPIAHNFWDMQGQQAFMEKMTVLEHVSVVGGLIAISIAAELRRRLLLRA